MHSDQPDTENSTLATDPDARLAAILTGVGHASYMWDITDDSVVWSANFVELTGLLHSTHISSGRGFEKLISAESPQTRYGTVFTSEAANLSELADKGIPYKCLYAINSVNTKGDDHVWIEDWGRWYPDENGKPIRAEGVVRIANERREREERLRMKSDFDELTGLPNRRFLCETLERTATGCFANNTVSSFMLFSLERLELINTTYGFHIGDEVLKSVANILKENLRGGDVISRFSGAKFGLILNDCEGGELFVAAKRFLSAVENGIIRTDGGPVALRGVVGAAILPKHAKTSEEAIGVATCALDEARKDASLRIEIYNPDPVLITKRREEAELVSEVISALDDGRMGLAYQPVVNASSHSIAFHESLLRMHGPDGIISTAGRFIGTAEKLGLIRFVDLQAQRLTLQTLAEYPDAKLSLNVSHETADDPEWISKLAGTLMHMPGAASRLIVEITESHAARDIRETKKFVSMIKDLGCRVAIDDFGAGYTSFSNLRDLDIDVIKIDGSFCKNLLEDSKNQVFIRSLIDLSKAFDVETVVEWVESVEVAAQLSNWGVDFLQGSVFGMPLIVAPWEKCEQTGQEASIDDAHLAEAS